MQDLPMQDLPMQDLPMQDLPNPNPGTRRSAKLKN